VADEPREAMRQKHGAPLCPVTIRHVPHEPLVRSDRDGVKRRNMTGNGAGVSQPFHTQG
jgi:hypothetical protein